MRHPLPIGTWNRWEVQKRRTRLYFNGLKNEVTFIGVRLQCEVIMSSSSNTIVCMYLANKGTNHIFFRFQVQKDEEEYGLQKCWLWKAIMTQRVCGVIYVLLLASVWAFGGVDYLSAIMLRVIISHCLPYVWRVYRWWMSYLRMIEKKKKMWECVGFLRFQLEQRVWSYLRWCVLASAWILFVAILVK